MELLMNLLCVVWKIFLNFISTVMRQDYHVIGKTLKHILNNSKNFLRQVSE